MANKAVMSREEEVLNYFNDENEPISARILVLKLANSAMAKNGGEQTAAPVKTRKPRKSRNSAPQSTESTN